MLETGRSSGKSEIDKPFGYFPPNTRKGKNDGCKQKEKKYEFEFLVIVKLPNLQIFKLNKNDTTRK